MQFRARPTAALKARPVVVTKSHFGVFAAAVSTDPFNSTLRTEAGRPPSRRLSREPVRGQSDLAFLWDLFLAKCQYFFFFVSGTQTTDHSPSLSLPPQQNADTLEKVRTIISEQLGTDLDAVAADAKFVDLGADSLDTVEIMMALEEQFEITLDEEGAEKIATVQEAADMIQEQMA